MATDSLSSGTFPIEKFTSIRADLIYDLVIVLGHVRDAPNPEDLMRALQWLDAIATRARLGLPAPRGGDARVTELLERAIRRLDGIAVAQGGDVAAVRDTWRR